MEKKKNNPQNSQMETRRAAVESSQNIFGLTECLSKKDKKKKVKKKKTSIGLLLFLNNNSTTFLYKMILLELQVVIHLSSRSLSSQAS